MNSGSFKISIMYLVYMHKEDLALNDRHWLMRHKTKRNETKRNETKLNLVNYNT